MAKHHFSETQHDAMNISDVCPIMPHVFYLNSRYLSYWNPHQIIGQLHGLLIADHRQFSIWSTTDGVVPKRSHREPNSFANFQSEKKFNSAWSSSRPNKIRKYEVPSSQSFFRQFLSSKQYFVGFNIFGRWRHDIESLRQVGDGCTCALTLPKVVWFSCRNNKHFLPCSFNPVHPVAIASAFWLGIFLECTCCCSWHENESDPTHLS